MLDKIKSYLLKIRWLRITFVSVQGFIQDQCSLRASALTYYTIMSIVPVFALAFLIAGEVGLYDRFKEQMLIRFSDQKEVFAELFKYADTLLSQTKGGIVASFGIAFLVLTVILLLSSLEGILNHIWKVKSLRSWWRIFTDYMTLMIFTPIFFVLSNSVSIFFVEKVSQFIRALPIPEMAIDGFVFSVNLLSYSFFWILFTVMYLFMPNTKVQFRSALIAGVFAGTLYLIVQWGYIYFQIGAARYGAIYGSIAAIPLFLVWLQISWSLFLWGAELSYAHQTIEKRD